MARKRGGLLGWVEPVVMAKKIHVAIYLQVNLVIGKDVNGGKGEGEKGGGG